jgi:hypothetical protein
MFISVTKLMYVSQGDTYLLLLFAQELHSRQAKDLGTAFRFYMIADCRSHCLRSRHAKDITFTAISLLISRRLTTQWQ